MAGDDEATLLAAGHVEAKLLLGGEGEELVGQAVHVGNEGGVDAVIDDLEDAPVLAGLDDVLADLGAAATVLVVVDAGEGDDGDLVAEDVVGDLGAFVLVADEGGLEGLLVRYGGESGRSRSHSGG